jgi:hypothetical protein
VNQSEPLMHQVDGEDIEDDNQATQKIRMAVRQAW